MLSHHSQEEVSPEDKDAKEDKKARKEVEKRALRNSIAQNTRYLYQ